MASTQDLKRRVRSITNTRKVTKAMELVASARLRRAQMRIEAMRPYADRMLELMAGVSQAAGSVRLPLLERREEVKTGRDRAGHRRPRPRRRVQRAGDPALARAQARGERGGPGGRLVQLGPQGGVDAALPPARGRAVVDRVQRAARVRRRAGDGARGRRGVRRAARSTRCSSSTTRSCRRSCRR